ncbi:ABC transporter permease [Fimbriiglobus ruber]|uniref:ABC transporter, permease protein n=1 Tax=Fimbriiglobus ruber TaxID=1908690 RepID=A0A225D516_9BACT|nr:ABC transporter permease [Fimbriiglobus ruber]OWK36670.1 ABC transporter, permease protein [Fimbriiglobus ruber]
MHPEMSQYMSGPADTSLMQLAVYAVAVLFGLLALLTLLAAATLPLFFVAMLILEFVLRGVQNLPDPIGKSSKIAGLVFRSLRRNLLRTALTYIALFVLTGMLTFIYSIVSFLGALTKDKEDNQLILMTEKFTIPSQMPPGYASQLKGVMQTKLPPELRPKNIDENFMTWSFVLTSLDPTKLTQENNVMLFALDPDAVLTMMSEQGLNKEDLGEDGWAELVRTVDLVKQDKRNIVVGEDRLKMIDKKVGDEIKLYGQNYKDLEFECKIVGAFPSGSRMGMNAAMRFDYLMGKLDDYKNKKGTAHPQGDRCVNLIWVRMPTKAAYEQLASIVSEPGTFSGPAVKMETFSAAVGAFLDPFKDIFWGMKYIIMPAIMVIMCLVIGITITIGVRERWAEMAVMKVLGFQPWQVMSMVVAEAVLVGVFGGLLSTWTVFFLPRAIKWATKAAGIRFAFFDSFGCPSEILIYGPLLGVLVGVIGSALPSWNARKVKVSEVFAQVT